MRMGRNRMKSGSIAAGLLTLLVSVLTATPQPATAAETNVNGCIQEAYAAAGNTQTLTCTASDVRIAKVTNITVTAGGSGTCTDVSGDCKCVSSPTPPTDCATNPNQVGCVTFNAEFQVLLGAQARYDIGLYIASDGGGTDGTAKTGHCFSSIITATNAPATFTNPDPTDLGLKPLQPNDICGDIDGTAAHNPQKVNLTVSVACVAGADGKLNLPNCTSWRQPGSNETCDGVEDAYPGAPSKCNCQDKFPVNIKVATPTLTTTKTARTTVISEGSTADIIFDVIVKNNGTIAVDLESLTDDIYGDISTVQGDVKATTCGPLPITIPGGQQLECSFTATVSAVGLPVGTGITDVVCAAGTDTQGDPVGGTQQTDPPSSFCDDATVTVEDVASDATVTKTVESATITYKVVVHNSSQVDTLVLKSLCDDKFGDISGNAGSVPACAAGTATLVSTTCANLPVNLAAGGADYECTFVGRITESETNTVTGKLTDSVDATLTRSDSASVTLTD